MAKNVYIGIGNVARKVKKCYIGIHKVPQKVYTVLEYIQSTGSQYINTGVLPSQANTYEATFLKVSGTNDIATVFGCNASSPVTDRFGPIMVAYSGGISSIMGNDWAQTNISGTNVKKTASAYCPAGGITKVTVDGTSATIATAQNNQWISMFAFNGNGVAADNYWTDPLRIYSASIKNNSTLIRNYVAVKRISDGAIGLYDKVEGKFYGNNGTGTFTAGAETGEYIYDIPQEGDYARPIKKAYIGIGGVARPFWGGGELAYYGTATPLSAGRIGGGTANAGTYLLAAGGAQNFTVGSTHFATVDVYDAYLTHTTAANRSVSGYHNHPNCGGASAGAAYALFAGGYNAPSYTSYANVDAYSQNLTKTAAPSLDSALNNLSGFTLGNKGFFGHGTTYVYDTNLTRSAVTGLAGANRFNSATVGGYGVLTGDETTNAVAYNESMTRTALTKSQYGGSGCAGAGYALFARESYAYAYTPDLTLVTLTPLSVSRWGANTAYLDGFSLFAGGDDMSVVDAYQGLTRVVTANLSSKRTYAFSGTVGNYALFCGGLNSGTVVSTTDVFTVA